MKRFLLSLIFLCLFSLPSQAVVLCNNGWMTTATSGTGTLTVGTAVSGAQSFVDCGITNGQTIRYRIFDGAAWEVGSGVYTTAGTTLTRVVLESSNADAAIDLSGTATVIITPLTADLPSESTPVDTTIDPTAVHAFLFESGTLKRTLLNLIRGLPDVQTFTATGAGTWTKLSPLTGQTMCYVQIWGAGGSGGKGAAASTAGGGGGGAYKERFFKVSDLAATEAISVGTGGVGQTSASTDGNVGGNTTFGAAATLLTAHGGGGGDGLGNGGGGGGGGGARAAGGAGGGALLGGSSDGIIGTVGNVSVGPYGTPGGEGVASGNAGTPRASFMGGAGGGGATGDATGNNAPGGSSEWGGAGGGAGAEDVAPGPGIGGVSQFGGNGGAGAFDANAATAGVQPGGGGGGSETGTSGAGGNGKAVVTCF